MFSRTRKNYIFTTFNASFLDVTKSCFKLFETLSLKIEKIYMQKNLPSHNINTHLAPGIVLPGELQ